MLVVLAVQIEAARFIQLTNLPTIRKVPKTLILAAGKVLARFFPKAESDIANGKMLSKKRMTDREASRSIVILHKGWSFKPGYGLPETRG